ncbi:ABC transporter permease [Azorhizobium oxalatiphilum]|uniref:ABC transporter permease n=1 Tax=Azorhizobium oxalatiphilum TaxID=980631 RepID=A0A917F7U7_9HYPH|nr:ABC transporter permease [Azorhizobium oxalatiphilum]GGF58592.1 ABC transporter permease [Azorhizobium oxalatiphilum]
MELFLSQILNGLAIGQVYALIALGFSLVFGVANIINFAQGALFMLGAFIAYSAIAWFGLPLIPAAIVSVVIVAILGLLLERIALRPLMGAPYIAPFLSTLAISTIIDQSAEIIWSPESQPFPASISSTTFFIGNAYITVTDLVIFGFGAAATIALTLFVSYTWTGRALRATAQDPAAAAQLGIRTDVMRQIAFGLAGALGALSGILVALYFQSVFPQMGIPFGLKGFAAALLGGLARIPGAVVGGLLLGIGETLASAYVGDSYRDAIAFSLLLLMLLVRPNGLLGGGKLNALGGSGAAAGAMPTTSLLASASSQLSATRAYYLPAWGFLVVGAAFALVPLLVSSTYVLQALIYGFIFALLAVSVSLVSGAAGILSIGHAAFFGVGAYAVAVLARPYGLSADVTLLAAVVLTALVALIAAIPLLKLSGHTAALGTLAIGQIGFLVFLNWVSVTRGPMGILNIPHPVLEVLGGLRFATTGQKYWLVLGLVVIAVVIAERYVSSPIGRTWRAIREDRLAAQASGLPVRRYILLAFAISGALAGLAGGLFAYVQQVVSPESFTVETSILILTMAVLGGLGNLSGAVLTGFALAILPEFLRGFEEWRMIIYGLLLLVALRVRPQGLLGAR